MTPFDAERQVDPLGHFWNEVVAGRPATPDDLDPALAATVRRVQVHGAAPAPDSAFAARLWEDLMNQSRSANATIVHPGPVPLPSLNGRAPSAGRRPFAVRRLNPRRWWPMLELAAAALLLIALGSGLVALNGGLPDRFNSSGGQDATPTAERSAPLAVGNVVAVPPAGEGPAAIEVVLRRDTLAPGAIYEIPPVAHNTFLESGSVRVQTAADADGWDRMGPGDSLSSTDTSTVFHNDGSVPAVLLHAMIGPRGRGQEFPADVRIQDLGRGLADLLPAGPALFAVESVLFEPGEGENVDTGRDGLALIAVEAGTLALSGQAGRTEITQPSVAASAAAASVTATLRDVPSSVLLGAGDSALLQGGAVFTLVNRGDDALRLLVVTVEPNAAAVDEAGESIAAAVYGTAPPMTDEPMATPTADADVVAPEACDVAPRSAESIRALADLGSATPISIANEMVDTVYEDDLPAGAPMDAAALAIMTEIESEFAACWNAGDYPRLLALLTDDSTRELLADSGAEVDAMVSGAPRPLPTNERLGVFPLRGARLLADGRIGAIVEWAEGDDLRRVSESNFHIYVLIDGRWLLDEEISFRPYP